MKTDSTNMETAGSPVAVDPFPAPLTDLERRAAMFGVTSDADLSAKIKKASEGIDRLKSAHGRLQEDIDALRGIQSEFIRAAVDGIRTGTGCVFGARERGRLGLMPGRIKGLQDILDEIGLEIDTQSARLSRLQERMEESLKSAISIAEREAREKCRAFVHQGHGTRPVVSQATISSVQGETRLVCQGCERTIARVDTSMLAGGLSADAFTDLSGHPLFDGDDPKGWRCPGCSLGPIIDPRWILTDSWRFYEVGAQRRTGSPNKNAPEAHEGGLTGGLSNQSARVAVALIC